MSLKTITWHSFRGGVGKSLIAVNTAVKLSQLGYKVVMIDFDLRAPSLQSYFISNGKRTKMNYVHVKKIAR